MLKRGTLSTDARYEICHFQKNNVLNLFVPSYPCHECLTRIHLIFREGFPKFSCTYLIQIMNRAPYNKVSPTISISGAEAPDISRTSLV